MTIGKFGHLACAVMVGVGPAVAETPDNCAIAFHDALAKLDQSSNVGAAVAALRAPDASLPGRWLFSDKLLGKPQRRSPPVVAQVCLESIKVYGRIRCQRFADADAPPKPPAELLIDGAPLPAELKLLKSLADIVDSRGAVPDVGPNGRQRWLAERGTSDIKTYLTQPIHPAICSGAKEVAEFYSTQLQPLVRRATAVAELARQARALAQKRIDDLLAAPPAATKPDEKSPAANDEPRQTVSASTPPPPAAAPPPASDTPQKDLVALTVDAVRPSLAADAVTAITAEKTAIAALTRAKAALADTQAAAIANGDQALGEKINASARALRMLEAAAYAEIYAARFAAFEQTVATTPDAIRKAHAALCTCGP